MYSSGYSQVFKSSPQAQKKMVYRSKGKSCGYYMRIVFFFSSLIQSLIIVSLVLFLVYGKKQDSASTSRIHDLEESFSRLSLENVALKQQRKNLTNLLNTTLTEKSRNDWDLKNLLTLSNMSLLIITDTKAKLQQCSQNMLLNHPQQQQRFSPFKTPDNCNCDLMTQTLKTKLVLVESNFTETTSGMRAQLDKTTKERDTIDLEVIRLRREINIHEKEVELLRQKCKEDFSQSLSGISDVSRAFLQKIDSLFPSHIAFQLTCPKQREHLEQIRTNCSSLSSEVETKLQHYLDVTGRQITVIVGENSRLKAENWRLSEDYRSCSNKRADLIQQNRKNIDKLQEKHDEDKEALLNDKMRLIGVLEVEKNNVKYHSKKMDELTEQIKKLNVSCASKTGFGLQGGPAQSGGGVGGSNSGLASPYGGGQLGRSGSGGLSPGFGSALNKPPSTGTGSSSSSLLSTGVGGSTGSEIPKQGSTGISSSTRFTHQQINKPVSTSLGSSSSSTGLGSSVGSTFNKLGSTGTGSSTGSVLNKPASTGGMIPFPGSYPQSSGGTGSNKPALSGKGFTPVGSASGSSYGSFPGSTNKGVPTNSGTSWSAPGNSGQSQTGSGTGAGSSTGNSVGQRSVNIDQHLRDLQRFINPTGPQDKQDLSRMLG
ncbi:plasmalemma vesicle associated protein a [Pungitius pungitius]|uniref:plasmalemma vesicle associated protein a n=1 Tax=Pungitius pungitius TaxID=134920 RepID=UPI002E15DEC5